MYENCVCKPSMPQWDTNNEQDTQLIIVNNNCEGTQRSKFVHLSHWYLLGKTIIIEPIVSKQSTDDLSLEDTP